MKVFGVFLRDLADAFKLPSGSIIFRAANKEQFVFNKLFWTDPDYVGNTDDNKVLVKLEGKLECMEIQEYVELLKNTPNKDFFNLPKGGFNKEIYTYKEKTGTLMEICTAFGRSYQAVRDDMTYKGMSLEEALKIDRKEGKVYTFEGVTDTLPNLCEKFGRVYTRVLRRIQKMSFEEAFQFRWYEKVYKYREIKGTVRQLSEELKLDYSYIAAKMNDGVVDITEIIEGAIKLKKLKEIGKDPAGHIHEYKGTQGTLKELFELFRAEIEDPVFVKGQIMRGLSFPEAMVAEKREYEVHEYRGERGTVGELIKRFNIRQDLRDHAARVGAIHRKMRNNKMTFTEAADSGDGRAGETYTYKGVTGDIKTLAKHFDMNLSTVRMRVKKYNWDFDKVFGEEVKEIDLAEYKGEYAPRKTLIEKYSKNSLSRVEHLINKGLTLEDAIDWEPPLFSYNEVIKKFPELYSSKFTFLMFKLEDGTVMSLPDICEKENKAIKTVVKDLLRGNTLEEALRLDATSVRTVKVLGQEITLRYFNIIVGKTSSEIEEMLRQGLSAEEIYRKYAKADEVRVYDYNGFIGTIGMIANHVEVSVNSIDSYMRKHNLNITEAVRRSLASKERRGA